MIKNILGFITEMLKDKQTNKQNNIFKILRLKYPQFRELYTKLI